MSIFKTDKYYRMATLNVKGILFIIVSFILGYSVAALLRGCGSEQAVRFMPVRPITIENQVQKEEHRYKQLADSLGEKSRKITNELALTEKELGTARRNNRVLQHELLNMAEAMEKSLNRKDTVRILENCAELFPKARELVESANFQDSLCDESLMQLKQLALVKDSLIAVVDQKYEMLRQQFNRNQDILAVAIKENQGLRKQIRKQKIKNTLVSVAGVITSGLALKWLIQK